MRTDHKALFGAAGQFVTVDSTDLSRVLGDDPGGLARAAFQRLCDAGCDPLTLTYILKVIRERLPNPWCDPTEESDRQEMARRDDADALDRAASIIETRYALLFPAPHHTDERNKELVSLDDSSAQMGGLGPVRLAAGLRSFAFRLRQPELMHEAGLLRWNQNDFDMISRYLLCAYQPQYFADMDEFLMSNPVAGAELVFCPASNLFARTFTMRSATVFQPEG